MFPCIACIYPSRVERWRSGSLPSLSTGLNYYRLNSKVLSFDTMWTFLDFKCDLLALDAPYYLLGCVLRDDLVVV